MSGKYSKLFGRMPDRLLVDGMMQAGYHELHWDGKDDNYQQVPTGIYLCKLSTKNYQKSIRMLFMK